jgi:RNA polymerase sigma-70 factor (ECF subfamily)
MSDLLDRCRAGEALAVEALVRAHQDAVYRLAYSILGDADEADEAAQETFLAALGSLDRYRGEAAFTTWLYAVTVNVCRMRRRRWQVWARLQEALAGLMTLAAPPPSPEEAVAQAESSAALWRAVMALGDVHRVPVILRYYYDCPVAEIAQVLGLPEGTVHSRLTTARDRLRAALQRGPTRARPTLHEPG